MDKDGFKLSFEKCQHILGNLFRYINFKKFFEAVSHLMKQQEKLLKSGFGFCCLGHEMIDDEA